MNNVYNAFTSFQTPVQVAIVAALGAMGVTAIRELPNLAEAIASSGGKIEINNNGFSLGSNDALAGNENPQIETK